MLSGYFLCTDLTKSTANDPSNREDNQLRKKSLGTLILLSKRMQPRPGHSIFIAFALFYHSFHCCIQAVLNMVLDFDHTSVSFNELPTLISYCSSLFSFDCVILDALLIIVRIYYITRMHHGWRNYISALACLFISVISADYSDVFLMPRDFDLADSKPGKKIVFIQKNTF